ncbi:MAG: right-handed parallel beta-helix repeat-containing protein, partial [Rikenellaceae bacterium]
MIKILKLFSFLLLSSVVSLQDGAAQVVRIPCSDADATTSIREAIEAAAYQDEIIIELEEGTYLLNPDLAFEKYAPITNHGNGLKKIAFPISGYKKVVIEGNGAKLIFHGQMMPFLFEDCENIEVRNLTINWDIPFTFLAEVVATSSEEGWREVKPRGADDGFSWRLSKGEILFPDVDGFSYSHLGSTLAFDAQTKRPIEGVLDLHSEPTR